MPPTPMTKEAASRIQSASATSGQNTGAGTFAARAQSAGDRNANATGGGGGGKTSGGGNGQQTGNGGGARK